MADRLEIAKRAAAARMAPGRAAPRYAVVIAIACAVVTAMAAWASVAHADNRIFSFSVTPSTTQAGGHPDVVTEMWLANNANTSFPDSACNCEDPRTINIDLPPGLVGAARAIPQCSAADFVNNECPIDSQVGLFAFTPNAVPPPVNPLFPTPVYNLIPHPGQAGLFGFPAPIINSPVYLAFGGRTESDYGLTVESADITHVANIGISALKLTIWGVPADPVNDAHRLGPRGCDPTHTSTVEDCVEGFSSNTPPTPLLSNPTTCGEPLSAGLSVLWYDRYRESTTAPFPATTGCDKLSFNPSLFGRPTTTATDSPSGFDIDLKVPQDSSPTVPSPSEIRNATVTLPEGFSINSNAADGKVACTDAEAKFGTRDQAECPEFSKIGSLTVSSSALPGPLPGYVYVRPPTAENRYRIVLVADGFGLHVKLPGVVTADPVTGQVTTSFRDLPQFPFSEFNIHYFGAERGLLATPTRCGTYPVTSTFTPWDSALPEQTSTQYFVLDSGPNGSPCPGAERPFTPGFQAGVADKTAGAHSSFSLELTRDDGTQNLAGLTVSSPPGFSATLKGIPYCPEAVIAGLSLPTYSGLEEQASSACPSASQIGVVYAGAGAGSRPLYVGGKVFLAGPYKGAPLSLVAVIPAVSGPYDLGNVVVRAALRVDPHDAHVTAVSDPLPQIIGGIPLRTRLIRINLNRPSFALNPTNCDRGRVTATVTGDEDGVADLAQHFQVANCADLPFRPNLRMSLAGGTTRGGHPAIRAVLKARPGDANIGRVATILPGTMQLDQSHLGAPCTRDQFAANACPEDSRMGTATIVSPLLDEPLTGPVYLRTSTHRLPDLVADLHGQVDLTLEARIDSVRRHLRATFEGLPDAPVTSATFDLAGGKKSLVVNNSSLCRTRNFARVAMRGQNGRRRIQKSRLRVPCGKTRHRTHKRHRVLRARKVG